MTLAKEGGITNLQNIDPGRMKMLFIHIPFKALFTAFVSLSCCDLLRGKEERFYWSKLLRKTNHLLPLCSLAQQVFQL